MNTTLSTKAATTLLAGLAAFSLVSCGPKEQLLADKGGARPVGTNDPYAEIDAALKTNEKAREEILEKRREIQSKQPGIVEGHVIFVNPESRALDGEGRPGEGVNVVVLGNGQEIGRAITDREGQFRFTIAASARTQEVAVTFSKPGYASHRTEYVFESNPFGIIMYPAEAK